MSCRYQAFLMSTLSSQSLAPTLVSLEISPWELGQKSLYTKLDTLSKLCKILLHKKFFSYFFIPCQLTQVSERAPKKDSKPSLTVFYDHSILKLPPIRFRPNYSKCNYLFSTFIIQATTIHLFKLIIYKYQFILKVEIRKSIKIIGFQFSVSKQKLYFTCVHSPLLKDGRWFHQHHHCVHVWSPLCQLGNILYKSRFRQNIQFEGISVLFRKNERECQKNDWSVIS